LDQLAGFLGLALTPLDAMAVAWFALIFIGYQNLSRIRWFDRRSIAGAVQRHRITWMRNMAVRENRMSDSMLMQQLGQGNAFFASTSAIGIGALLSLLGAGDKMQALIEKLPFVARTDGGLFDVKLMLLVVVFVYAFFKFAWAFRLSHYCGIMIGATPVASADNKSACEVHADQVSALIGIAADHANRGLRAFYFAIAAMTWVINPVVFLIATTWVLVILVRRDFYSRSRRVLAGIGGET
jgi:uncharacterized membrane protein